MSLYKRQHGDRPPPPDKEVTGLTLDELNALLLPTKPVPREHFTQPRRKKLDKASAQTPSELRKQAERREKKAVEADRVKAELPISKALFEEYLMYKDQEHWSEEDLCESPCWLGVSERVRARWVGSGKERELTRWLRPHPDRQPPPSPLLPPPQAVGATQPCRRRRWERVRPRA